MLRTLLVVGALSAAALPAAATTTVKVNVAGLDTKAAHIAIVRAAHAACRIELRDASTFEVYYFHQSCVASAVARAEADHDATTASATADVRVAGR